MIIIETKLEFKKYLLLMYILTYRKPFMILTTIAGLAMFIGSSLYFLGLNMGIESPPYFQIVFGFAVVVLFPISIYRSTKKNFFSYSQLQEKMVYEFTDEGIKLNGENFAAEWNWTKIHKIVELKDWILIYQNAQVFNILPKESIGNNMQDFRALVKKNVRPNLM